MANNSVSYSELFSVSFLLPFYQNGHTAKNDVEPETDYAIHPTRESQDLLDKLDMVMKKDAANGKFTIWARIRGESGVNKELYFKPAASMQLSFIISLQKPAFVNYTDLPLELEKDKIYYFNNLLADASAPRSELHLNRDPAGVGLSDTLRKVSHTYRYVHGAAVTEGSVKLRHLKSGLVVSPQSLLNEGGKAFITFGISRFPKGVCEVQIGGAGMETAYHLEAPAEQTAFAVLDFSLAVLPLPNYRIIENDGLLTPQRPLYTLLFTNRSTYWRYKVLLQENSPLYQEIEALSPAGKADFYSKLQLVSNDTSVSFSSHVISDKHLEFVSDSELPLQEKYLSTSGTSMEPLILSLKKYRGEPMKEEDVKAYLPYPSIRQLHVNGGAEIYSDILLNL